MSPITAAAWRWFRAVWQAAPWPGFKSKPRRRARGLALLAAAIGCSGGAGPPAPPLPTPPRLEVESVVLGAEQRKSPPLTPVELAATPEPTVAGGAAKAAPGRLEVPSRIRVGLATDQEVFTTTCCRWRLRAGRDEILVEGGFAARAKVGAGSLAVYRVQVAALKDSQEAARVAQDLEGRAAQGSEVVFDAGDDLYRVRVGRFPQRSEAERLRERLVSTGYPGAWIAREGGDLSDAGFEITSAGRTSTLLGRELVIERLDGYVSWGAEQYRGEIVLVISVRGALNVVNELDFEDYLRGVVPKELGPDLYPELEALKAQSVAARTYTARNLGEFQAEGYDICSTPRCQVYGGVAVEHPLSDRAVAATNAEVVVFEDEFVDAMYSATCGGHTEDVAVVFPLKSARYLHGVGCIESGAEVLQGRSSEVGFVSAVLENAVGGDTPTLGLEEAVERIARRVGLPATTDSLRREEGQEVRRYLSARFDLTVDPSFLLAETSPANSAGGRSYRPRGLGWLMARGALSRQERDAVLLDLALALHLVEIEPVLFGRVRPLTVRLTGARGDKELPTTGGWVSAYRSGDQFRLGPVSIYAGQPLELWHVGTELVALVAEGGRSFPKVPDGSWSFFRSRAALVSSAAVRFPGFRLKDFEILERGVSGRVERLRLVDGDRRGELIEGLAIRWLLDLPDTLFWAEAARDGWWFRGRGHGHGVGLCQRGSVLMSTGGSRYDEILRHYYTGVTVKRVAVREVTAATSASSGGGR